MSTEQEGRGFPEASRAQDMPETWMHRGPCCPARDFLFPQRGLVSVLGRNLEEAVSWLIQG